MLGSPKAGLAAAVALLLGSTIAEAQAPQMVLTSEVNDGFPQDIAAWPDASTNPSTRRAWVCQGRSRAAFNLGTLQREFGEEATFSSVAPPRREYPRAVEVQVGVPTNPNDGQMEPSDKLWTLTDSALYREEIEPGGTTTDRIHLPFEFTQPGSPPPDYPSLPFPWTIVTLLEDEELMDIKVHTGPTFADDRVIVLTTYRVLIVEEVDGFPGPNRTLQVTAQITDLYDRVVSQAPANRHLFASGTSCPTAAMDPGTFNGLKVGPFSTIELAQDGSDLIALITAQMGTRGSGERRVDGILVANLDAQNGFLNPTLNVNPGPDTCYVFWDPYSALDTMDCPGGGNPTLCSAGDFVVWDMDTVHAGGDLYLIAACGRFVQAQVMKVTSIWSNGFPAPSSPDIDRIDVDNPNGNYVPVGNLVNVLVDPEFDTTTEIRFFVASSTKFAGTNSDFFVVRWPYTSPGSAAVISGTASESYGEGNPRDMAFTQLLDGAVTKSTVWAANTLVTDHVLKVTDVTSDTSIDPLFLEYPMVSSSDGAVATDSVVPPLTTAETIVYLPTFGGVLPFQYNVVNPLAPFWQPRTDWYQPAEVPFGSGNVRNTEHIEIAEFGQQRMILTASARADGHQYPLASNGALNGPDLVLPDGAAISALGCTWAIYPSGHYGNDVAFVDLQPGSDSVNKFLLMDLRSGWFGPTDPNCPDNRRFGLCAFRWNIATSEWDFEGIVEAKAKDGQGNEVPYPFPSFGTGSSDFSHTITVAYTSDDPIRKGFAFVGHDRGFYTVKLNGLATGAGMKAVKGGAFAPGDRCAALATSQNRVFVWLESDPPKVCILRFNTNSGVLVSCDAELTFDQLPIAGGTETLEDIVGDSTGFRGRFEELDAVTGEGFIHIGTTGTLVQLKWPGLGAPNENRVTFEGYWNGFGDISEIQDCRTYDFTQFPTEGRQVLGVRNQESFTLIDRD